MGLNRTVEFRADAVRMALTSGLTRGARQTAARNCRATGTADRKRARHAPGAAGGAEEVTRAQIEEAADFDFRRFLLTRHSVRQFTDTALDDVTIRRIVTNAPECLNLCNRHTVKVYACNNYDDMSDEADRLARQLRGLLCQTSDGSIRWRGKMRAELALAPRAAENGDLATAEALCDLTGPTG